MIGKLDSSMERTKKQQRGKRNTSTFSTYYLNDNTKELMNINSCSQIGGDDFITRADQATTVQRAPTHGTHTLVGKLQNITTDGGARGHNTAHMANNA